MSTPTGVLIVGAYGTGKTSVCEETADQLESRHVAYGAIDLDWLSWYDAPGGRQHDRRDPVSLRNLANVVANYVSAGVEYFVLAGAVWSAPELDAIRSSLPFRPRVVQLTIPYELIEARLSSAPTSGRTQDLQEAKRQLEQSRLFADLVVANDRPIREVAEEVLRWLDWP
jgi:Ni2+-binding GTPase involved in maturation of urease and hydrogenase